MAVDPRLAMAAQPRVARFGATERRLHTIHASAFGVLLATGIVLYVPAFAQVVSDRPLVTSIHLVAAIGWMTALALVPILGDRSALRSTRREIERFDADDLLFLRRRPAAPARFNGGQKSHALAQAGLTLLFVISGTLLWLGERDTALRLPGTLALHDAATLAGALLVAGHISLSLSRPQSLEGIWRGTVPATYAAEHHPRWRARGDAATAPGRSGLGAARATLALLALGAGVAALLLVLG